jgi:hypothetical protein
MWPAPSAACLHEKGWLCGQLSAHFLGVIQIIFPDAHNFRRPIHWRSQPGRRVDQRASRATICYPLGQTHKAVGGKKSFVVIVKLAAGIHSSAVRQQNSWLFAARITKSDQLHDELLADLRLKPNSHFAETNFTAAPQIHAKYAAFKKKRPDRSSQQEKPNNLKGISVGPPCLATGKDYINTAEMQGEIFRMH